MGKKGKRFRVEEGKGKGRIKKGGEGQREEKGAGCLGWFGLMRGDRL